MAGLGDLVVKMKADNSHFNRGVGKSQKILGDFAQKVLAVAAGAAGFGILKLAADAEILKVKLTTLLGSGEAAAEMFERIGKFAADTPFQKLDIGNAAQKLLAFNVSAEDIIPTLKSIGDIAALTGAPIGELAELYGKAQVQGRLFGEDINQLTGRGIPIIQELARQFGVAESEVKGLVAAGKVTADNITIAFQSMTTGAGKFAGGMADLSKTTAGQFSTLKDNLAAVGEKMGQVFLPVANKVLSTITGILQSTKDLPRGLLRMGAALVAVAVAFKAVTIAQLAYTKAAAIALALSGPKGWATLAAGIAIAAGAMLAVDHVMADVAEGAAEVAAEVDRASAAVDGIGKAAKSTKRDFTQLRNDMQEFEGMVATGPEAFFIKMVEAAKGVRRLSSSFADYEARMKRVVAQQSGFADALKQAQDDNVIAQGGSEIDQTIQGFRDMGVSEEELKTLRDALQLKEDIAAAEKKAQKAQKDAADLAEKQKRLDDFRLTEKIEAAREAVKTASNRGRSPGGVGVASRGSTEALSIILRSKGPQEQAVKELKESKAVLKALLELQKDKKRESFEFQGAV